MPTRVSVGNPAMNTLRYFLALGFLALSAAAPAIRRENRVPENIARYSWPDFQRTLSWASFRPHADLCRLATLMYTTTSNAQTIERRYLQSFGQFNLTSAPRGSGRDAGSSAPPFVAASLLAGAETTTWRYLPPVRHDG